MKSSASKIVTGAVAMLALSAVGPVAQAGTDRIPPAAPGQRHCVVEATVAGGPTALTAAPRCFGSFAAAIRAATEGTVDLPADATEVTQAQLDAGRLVDRGALTVIGIEYEDASFSGDDWVISQANGCTDGGAEVWLRSDLTGTAMNNVISSARTYSGCKSRHFENASFLGSSHLCGCASMGSMSDKTTSIRWSATGF